MKQLHSYLCLFAILLQTILASTFLNGNGATLKSKKPGSSRFKKAIRKSVKKNNLNSLMDLLLFEKLVKLVIDYFNDGTYPITVSTHSGLLFKSVSEIAVDSARLYVMADAKGIKGLDHSLANVKEDERRLVEFAGPQWFDYRWFSSSCDGRSVSFSHRYEKSTVLKEQAGDGIKWFIQSNEPEDRKLKRVALDDNDLPYGLLSQDGQTLCSYHKGVHSSTHIYRLKKEAGKDPVALMKFKLNGTPRAVSGNGNCVLLEKTKQLEIHDISTDASKLLCQFNMRTDSVSTCTLNEDGSEAACVTYYYEMLLIIKVDKTACAETDQPATVGVNIPKSAGRVSKLVYDNGGRLHVLHNGGKISFFDPSTKEFTLLEAPQMGQRVISGAISPNAKYIATIQNCDEEDQLLLRKIIVKRKLDKTDFKDFFGYENPSGSVKPSAVLPEEATLTQVHDALSQSIPAPLTRLTTIPAQRGGLCAFDGNLKHRYVLDDGLMIHQKVINSDDDRGSLKLPAAVVKGDPHYLQTNSDGTVFYLATRMNKKHYIYVIDVARKRIYDHHLEDLESDIVEIKARLDGKILEVILQDQTVLIFSCESQRLRLLNKLMGGKGLVGVSRSIAVFEERESTGLTAVGYFDLTKASASLCSLPYRNAKFVALDKNDVYLINAKSIVRFNVRTKKTATIKKHHAVRSSHVRNGIIRIVDHDFVYRVLNLKTFRQLHEIRLMSFDQQEDNPRTLISSDGRRVMVSQPDAAHIFEIVDPKFLHKTQAIEKPAGEKPVERLKVF